MNNGKTFKCLNIYSMGLYRRVIGERQDRQQVGMEAFPTSHVTSPVGELAGWFYRAVLEVLVSYTERCAAGDDNGLRPLGPSWSSIRPSPVMSVLHAALHLSGGPLTPAPPTTTSPHPLSSPILGPRVGRSLASTHPDDTWMKY